MNFNRLIGEIGGGVGGGRGGLLSRWIQRIGKSIDLIGAGGRTDGDQWTNGMKETEAGRVWIDSGDWQKDFCICDCCWVRRWASVGVGRRLWRRGRHKAAGRRRPLAASAIKTNKRSFLVAWSNQRLVFVLVLGRVLLFVIRSRSDAQESSQSSDASKSSDASNGQDTIGFWRLLMGFTVSRCFRVFRVFRCFRW